MRGPRNLSWFGSIVMLAVTFTVGAFSLEASAQSVPQLIYITRKGLDVANNEIDRLINTFGFICFRNPHNPRPCRIERELVSFLRQLVPNRAGVAHELSALGAVCHERSEQLECTYTRRVEVAAWIVGSSTPKSTSEEHFQIGMKVSGEDGLLRFEVKFKRNKE